MAPASGVRGCSSLPASELLNPVPDAPNRDKSGKMSPINQADCTCSRSSKTVTLLSVYVCFGIWQSLKGVTHEDRIGSPDV
jgi:hypothetical protein